ncbi:MAG: ATP-dependent 6-phosphofructokinase [Spirochaetales bacterium]|nr:ATP-dependent 6-phosphofructokinase [Spirochaetales bacterium]
MENLELTSHDLEIDSLGPPKIPSPLGLSQVFGDNIANYIEDAESVVLELDAKKIEAAIKKNGYLPAFIKAGPRNTIFFDPSKTRVAIVTCGGLCPGLNNVIRSLVMELYYRYQVRTIFGMRHGYRGFVSKYALEPVMLTPEAVKGIHEMGGSFIGSSRGPQDIGEIVDCMERMNISILFTIGGDGTLHGAEEIYREVEKRKLPIAVVGIPKTIDNDISYIEKTFGLETAFSVAVEAIRTAHTEAVGYPNGVGLVKLMGRHSGFIAANAALALNEVNFVLIPELPFDLEGPNGFFAALKKRLLHRGHAVIVVAEGAGQDLFPEAMQKRDESGNMMLQDIGIFLRDQISAFFKKENIELSMKYIDPSYLIRSVPANAHDAIYCMQLAQNAVHAGMSGYTGIVVGRWNGEFTLVPLKLANSSRKSLSPEDELWLTVVEATGQPFTMKNDGAQE